jgi:HSP20 family protein
VHVKHLLLVVKAHIEEPPLGSKGFWHLSAELWHHAGMRSRVQAIALPSEIGDFADEVRRVFTELGRAFGDDSLAGECSPPIDVYETDEALDIVVDLPGVAAGGVRLLARGDSILVVGEKAPRRVRGESSFHLVERGYGRFARVIRLSRPCDMSKAHARLIHGELHVAVPKVVDRRGRTHTIAISSERPSA